MTVAIYCRISQDPNEQEAGVRRQEADCRDLVAKHGLGTNITVYVDNDVSATQPMEERPEFMRMLADARDGQIQTIVAWRDDRLWRNPDHQRSVFSLAVDLGISRVITIEGVYDPTSISDKLMSGVKAMFAEYEAASTKLRVDRALLDRAVKGLPHGGARPFGFEPDRVTPRPAEVALLQEAMDRILAGDSIAQICRDWTEREVETVSGGTTWGMSVLRGILTNPRYVGKRVHRGEIIGRADWPAVLDEADWLKMQRLFTNRRRGPNPDKHLLGGFLYCSGCDDRLAVGYSRKRRVYRTHGTGNRDGSCGVSLSLPAEAAERLMRDAIVDRLSRGVVLDSEADDQSAEIIEEIDQLTGRLEELNDMWAAGELNRAERTQMRQKLVDRKEELEGALRRATLPKLPEDTPTTAEALVDAWDTRGTVWQRRLVAALAPRIDVLPSVHENGHECQFCGEPIEGRSRTAKYCSKRCGQRAWERGQTQKRAADDPYQGLATRLIPQWVA